jgi:hypothetical protein
MSPVDAEHEDSKSSEVVSVPVATGVGTEVEGTPDAGQSLDRITSVSDLMDRLKGTRTAAETLWYRGQVDATWGLQPRVARNRGFLSSEQDMLKRFRQDAIPRLRERPWTTWEWIFIAQHYGLPTRLLDWTENPLVGLFFASEVDNPHGEGPTDGALFELDAGQLNREAFTNAPRVIMFDEDEFLESYLPGSDDGPKQGPIAAVAGRSFDRIIAQYGTFTVNHREHVDLERVHEGRCVRKVIVPAAAKPHLRAELSDMNINASTVYPDLGHLADHVKGIYEA